MYRGGIYLHLGASESMSMPLVSGAVADDLWPHKIFKTICSNYGMIKMYNKAIDGSTSDTHAKAINYSLFCNPDLAIISLGGNDAANGAVTPTNYTANLTKLVTTIKRKNSNTVVILCAPWGITDSARTSYLSDIRTACQNVASTLNVGFCNLYNAWDYAKGPTYLVSDGIHPNLAGHIAIFNYLWAYVQTYATTWLNSLK